MTKLNRHQARQVAFQTLYGLAMNPDAQVEDIVRQVLTGDPEIEWTGELPQDVIDLVNEVVANQNKLDLQISNYLTDRWTIDRLNPVDLSLMRLALYEAQTDAVPAKVAIDEALQLAHEFTDDESRKFINGVLNKALTENK
ncbi:N utilization substance protein B [Weissella uvarum]|uniref:transcription antitermination factor NusB n=1 Tax=Weissella uvarum TaxID=1479233 RepID=UPI001961C9E6|nr:transcription antitermination factor NusB [Weissella uvarum]MBM7617979.1 N utilization substance protein B [Weissella uvarum]MCM0596198.1 transcription antitermination factor NusB [Weissella uvarum]